MNAKERIKQRKIRKAEAGTEILQNLIGAKDNPYIYTQQNNLTPEINLFKASPVDVETSQATTESTTAVSPESATEKGDWTKNFVRGTAAHEPVRPQHGKSEEKVHTYSGTKSDAREAIKKVFKDRKLDDNTSEALLIHIGAESGYNPTAKNPVSSAYGLGQWIGSNHSAVLDYVNGLKGTSYKNINELSLEDQAEAAAHWYYDLHKQLLDLAATTRDKVKLLAKLGLGPAIVTQGSYTHKPTGKTYKDTDEDYLAWFHDTGHDKDRKYTTFDQHIDQRYRAAGYTV